jgi:ABC-type polysaccharide/polyol phosphate transport system ATPase subunit
MSRPLAIEVRNVSKTFRIPTNRVPTLRERLLRPLQGQGHRELHALDDISLDVGKGEFLGIVGRNGSGKSTLLKLIASIYRADRGKIRVAGRLAPFIELGVGFNPEMTAYDNVVMNGVMMGLTRREARRRCDQVIAFAELEEFTELKLRNYSSGMRVRLAFAVMVQVDADVMLFDEVLAVGDAGFQQRSSETFFQLRERGKTIVLVTHSMADVMTYCHRAALIERGQIEAVGDPEEVSTRYTEMNFIHRKPDQPGELVRKARITDAWIEGASGEPTFGLQRREPIELRAEVAADDDIEDARFGFEIWTASGSRFFSAPSAALRDHGGLRGGERLRVAATIENRLPPGHYRVNCAVSRGEPVGGEAMSEVHGVDFEVSGEPLIGSLADFAHEMQVEPLVRTEVARR